MVGEGNVRVGVRVRPLIERELSLQNNPQNAYLTHPSPCQIAVNATKNYTFDYVFPSHSSQLEVYEKALKPLLTPFFDGFNVTVIAYGQTGSGKTYTMGSYINNSVNNISPHHNESLGCIPRFLDDVFARIHQSNSQETSTSITASFLEIYGEEIHDLLASHRSDTPLRGSSELSRDSLQIREDTSGVWVQDLKQINVLNRQEAMDQLHKGCISRVTGSTNMNETSSRSHAVYTVTVTQEIINNENNNNDSGISPTKIISKLTFVDLAGSERLKRTQAEGNRMKEGININVGLLALGNVINALGDDKRKKGDNKFVPYRSSKLTRLLQDALGGNSKTLFLACVSPSPDSLNETTNTLNYSNRARNIQNKAVKNIDSHSAELGKLRALVNFLKDELIRLRFKNKDSKDNINVKKYLIDLQEMAYSKGININSQFFNKDEEMIKTISTDISNLNSACAPITYIQKDTQKNPVIKKKGLVEETSIVSEEEIHCTLSIIDELIALDYLEGDYMTTERENQYKLTELDNQIFQKEAILLKIADRLIDFDALKQAHEKVCLQVEKDPNNKELLNEQKKQAKVLKLLVHDEKRTNEIRKSLEGFKESRIALLNENAKKIEKINTSIKEKEKKIEHLRQQNKFITKKGNSAALSSRNPSANSNFAKTPLAKNDDVHRLGRKLKDTEKKLWNLTKRRPRKINDITSKTIACCFENIFKLIEMDLDRDRIDVKLSDELKRRAELLEELVDVSKKPANTDEEELALKFEASEMELKLCEEKIVQLNEDKKNIPVMSLSKLRKEDWSKLSDKEMRDLCEHLVSEINEVKRRESFFFGQIRTAKAQIVKEQKEKEDIQSQMSNMSLFYQNKDSNTYEQQFLSVIENGINDEVEVDEPLVITIKELEEKNIFLQEQFDINTAKYEGEVAALKEAVQNSNNAFLAMEACRGIWDELGVANSDRSHKIDELNTIFIKKCEDEVNKLLESKQKMYSNVQLARARNLELLEKFQLHSLVHVDEEATNRLPLFQQEIHCEEVYKSIEKKIRAKCTSKLKKIQQILASVEELDLINCNSSFDLASVDSNIDFFRNVENIQHLKLEYNSLVSLVEQCNAKDIVLKVVEFVDSKVLSLDPSIVNDVCSALNQLKQERITFFNQKVKKVQSFCLEFNWQQDQLRQMCFLIASISSSTSERELLSDTNEKLNNLLSFTHNGNGVIDISMESCCILEILTEKLGNILDGRKKAQSAVLNLVNEDFMESCNCKSLSTDSLLMAQVEIETLLNRQNLCLQEKIAILRSQFDEVAMKNNQERRKFILNSVGSINESEFYKFKQYIYKTFGQSGEEDEPILEDQGNDKIEQFFLAYDPEKDNGLKFFILKQKQLILLVDLISYYPSFVSFLEKTIIKLQSLKKILKILNEIREYNKKIAEFEASASNSDRLFDRRGNGSLRLLEEEKFRKLASRRYPLLVKTIRIEVSNWLEGNEEEEKKSDDELLMLLGADLQDLLRDTMDTKTELMHLNLSVVDSAVKQKKPSVASAVKLKITSNNTATASSNQGVQRSLLFSPPRTRSRTNKNMRPTTPSKTNGTSSFISRIKKNEHSREE